MWRPRDRERFIAGYDPEHEMPDPDRDRGDRYESDAYRYNSRDSRYPYRWNPDRFESRFNDRDRWDYRPGWERDARDRDRNYRPGYGRDYGREYGRDYDRGYDRETWRGEGYGGADYRREESHSEPGRDRGWNMNRPSDYDRDVEARRGEYYEGDFGDGYDRERNQDQYSSDRGPDRDRSEHEDERYRYDRDRRWR